ncbi:hypothetical protein F5Y06DRAFT_302524 [Hypoxylon sp. FL0890]|nr:hypothetical protein F5Y06DRAFT_302524 [Hypoxylon sp. FL0890]
MFPGSLVFNTTAASLGIDHPQYVDNGSARYVMSNASLRNNRGEFAGTLSTMQFIWVEARRSNEGNRKLFSFIVLAGELEKYSLRNDYSFFKKWDNMWLLDIMLVERLPCKPFVARRVAMGTVKLCKWDAREVFAALATLSTLSTPFSPSST